MDKTKKAMTKWPACAWLPRLGEEKAGRRMFVTLPLIGDSKVFVVADEKGRNTKEQKARRRRVKAHPHLFDLHYRLTGHQKAQAYFRSSGATNKTDFGETFFPTDGLSGDWITKQPGNTEVLPPWVSALVSEGVITQDEANALTRFWHYFRFWGTLQQSAQLGGQFWAQPSNKALRAFVLSHDWSGAKFQKRKKALKPFKLPATPSCADIEAVESMNNWLYNQQALPVDRFHTLTKPFLKYAIGRQKMRH